MSQRAPRCRASQARLSTHSLFTVVILHPSLWSRLDRRPDASYRGRMCSPNLWSGGLFLCALIVSASLRGADTPVAQLVGQHVNEQWAEHYQKLERWGNTLFLAAYEAHGKKGPWDAMVRDLLGYNAQQTPGRNGQYANSHIIGKSDIVKSMGCDDPLVRYVRLRAMGDALQHADMEKMITDLKDRGYGPEFQFMAARRAVNARIRAKAASGPEYEALWQRMPDLIGPAFSLPPTNENCNNVVFGAYDVMWSAPRSGDEDFQSRQYAMLFAACDRAPGSEWWRLYIKGDYHIHEAWKARGNGWSSTVTESGWKGFAEHLKLARECLTKAWVLEPANGYAARRLITVGMGQGTGDCRLWFERSVAANPFHTGAFSVYIQTMSPRWCGSTEQLLSFASECVETKAYATSIPRYAMSCIRWAVVDAGEDADRVWRDPRTWACIDAINAGESKNPGLNRTEVETERMVYAWFCGKKAEAARLWHVYGAKGAKPVFDKIQTKPEVRARFIEECRNWDEKSIP